MELEGWGAGVLVKTKGREGQQSGTTFCSCEPAGGATCEYLIRCKLPSLNLRSLILTLEAIPTMRITH